MSRTPPQSQIQTDAWATASHFLAEDGYDGFGCATLEKPLSIDVYREWIADEFHGEMEYLKNHIPAKEDPHSQMRKARSAIVVQVMYAPHPVPPGLEIDVPLFRSPRVALYARGRDYHRWLTNRLKATCDKLRAAFPGHEFLPMSDSSPVLERDLAYRAGLGWVGKNTCVIHPKKGSLFFIGEIYTTLDLASAVAPVVDHCGTCTRCMDACPTGAIVEPRKLDARKCISYLTIESAGVPAEPLRTQIGEWLFGCDICQTVCPWNIKFNANGMHLEPTREASLEDDLRWILGNSKNQLAKHLRPTALNRAAGPKLKRNALVVAGNRRVVALRGLVQSYTTDPLLAELAHWALAQIDARP